MIYQCSICDKHMQYAPIAVHVVGNETASEEFTFAACPHCRMPVVFNRLDLGDGFDADDYYRVFPPHERAFHTPLPPVVRESYDEAVRCETHRSWIACVTMVGRTLEAVTKQYAPTERTMYQGLQKMHRDGIISQEISDWADELRVIRNYGAHATSQKITREDASEALDFLQAILETLYYMRPKFKAMKARRAAATAAAAPAPAPAPALASPASPAAPAPTPVVAPPAGPVATPVASPAPAVDV
ncbi:DUF4145 domain-containing protein [Stenotrophomonas maltophilia]|nr:DUF4145 domain-containing protein [Stenotrophomonas maltophilia]MBH1520805.1 DUF4145 domain-containing protein [Stenotrophomonas maltophilia]